MPVGNPGGGGSGAPTGAEYIVGAADSGLSAERVVTNTATVTWDLATAAQAKANVPDASISYAKIQDISAASRLLGRGSAAGAGDTEEISLGTGLSMSGTTLSGTGSGAGFSLGQVFLSLTKTNIGNAYVDVYVTAFDIENLLSIDFTGITEVRAVFIWDYVGTGTQQVRWVDVADNNNVLLESSTFTADQDPGTTSWVSLPAAFANSIKQIEWQGKSTTAGDDPIAKGYILFGR